MHSLAICDSRYVKSAERVALSEPLTCPPALETEYLLSRWGPADFIYVDLHGRQGVRSKLYAQGQGVWHVKQTRSLPGGKIVFFTTCHLPQTKFVEALSDNWLAMGRGENWGTRRRAVGAQLLALWMRRFLQAGLSPRKAFLASKARLVLTSWRRADRDALQFVLVPPRPGATEGEK